LIHYHPIAGLVFITGGVMKYTIPAITRIIGMELIWGNPLPAGTYFVVVEMPHGKGKVLL